MNAVSGNRFSPIPPQVSREGSGERGSIDIDFSTELVPARWRKVLSFNDKNFGAANGVETFKQKRFASCSHKCRQLCEE